MDYKYLINLKNSLQMKELSGEVLNEIEKGLVKELIHIFGKEIKLNESLGVSAKFCPTCGKVR